MNNLGMPVELIIVRGDLANKPISSQRLAAAFEEKKSKFEGVLYLGYPIIGSADGAFQIDALLVTRQTGIIVFNLIEGIEDQDYQAIQDENFTKLTSKLLQHVELTQKRALAVKVHTLTFAPAWVPSKLSLDDTYPCLTDEASLLNYILKLPSANDEHFEKVLSVLQSITNIRKTKSRAYILKENSRGARLKKLEESIANLDRFQNQAVIETVEGVQRIRGLAGSGKTIVLALKVAYLHSKNENWKIAVTYNTRSLRDQFINYIRLFCYEYKNEEPDWKMIDVIHAWGTPQADHHGIYYNLCADHNIEYVDFKGAKRFTDTYGKEFDVVCEKALAEIPIIHEKYDLILVDEAQDFSKEFLRICYHLLRKPKRLVYAYDELQSLNQKSMPSPEDLFGNDEKGNPLVYLVNEKGKPKQDVTLETCYRNPLELLSMAHALGFGIYRAKGLVQMFNDSRLWLEVGYKVEAGTLEEGEDVSLRRSHETSPEFLSAHSSPNDLISFHNFASNGEQIDFIVSEIVKNITEDELKMDDIMVINTDPIVTKSVVGAFRQRLFEAGFNSSLAGVTSSPDIFFQSDSITFTGINRAKGNEAAMVYIINSQFCFDGFELAKKRNILFTGITRSKAWVRICGYGAGMDGLAQEFQKVTDNNYMLTFKYPTKSERDHMNIVNRDMTKAERLSVESGHQSLEQMLTDLQKGKIKKEDIPAEILKDILKLIGNDSQGDL